MSDPRDSKILLVGKFICGYVKVFKQVSGIILKSFTR